MTSAGLFRRAVPVPITAAITGTATATIDEDDIVAGGKTIIITLTGDTWIAAGTGPIGTTAQTDAILAGIDSAQSETLGWDNEVKANFVSTDLVRTSATVATITIGAESAYDITAAETITVTIPASALTISVDAVIAEPTISVSDVVATTWTYDVFVNGVVLQLTPTMTMTVADVDSMLKNGVLTISGGQVINLSALSYTRDKSCDATEKKYWTWHSAGAINIFNPPCGVNVETFQYHARWGTSVSSPANLGTIFIYPPKAAGFYVDANHWTTIGITNVMTAEYVE